MKKEIEIKSDFLTIDQVCSFLQISRPSVHKLLNDGTLTRIKLGSCTRIRLSEIQKIK